MDQWPKLLLIAGVILVLAVGGFIFLSGPDTKGFAISLATDQDRYSQHEPITMHVGCARVTGSWTVSLPSSASLCDADIEIRDEKGAWLTTYLFPRAQSGTAVSRTIEKNMTVSEDIVLPGVLTSDNLNRFTVPFSRQITAYKFMAVWHAHSHDSQGDVQVIVRSKPVLINIIADD